MCKVTEIEKVAEGDAQKIWRIIKNTTLVQNLKDTDGGTLTKKLVTNRMAEAEAENKPLSYAQVEGIIENDTDGEVPKPSQPKKPDKDEPDLAMFRGCPWDRTPRKAQNPNTARGPKHII